VTIPPQQPGTDRITAEDRDQTGVQDLVLVADETAAERIADTATA
jgi:hypothetical protein